MSGGDVALDLNLAGESSAALHLRCQRLLVGAQIDTSRRLVKEVTITGELRLFKIHIYINLN